MKKAAVSAVLIAATVLSAQAQVQVDAGLPDYKAVQGVSGTIKGIGSDTMNNMMALWAEGFKKMYPNVQVEIEGKGSSTAPPALIEGTATFGPMSRAMKQQEIDSFAAKYGYKPTELPTSIDMLAVYVHKDNPVKALSLTQVDAIFSKNRKRGNAEDITGWGQLGLKGEWANLPISLYGRNAASGKRARQRRL
jgi:phosphate transport system substrate-binding protein